VLFLCACGAAFAQGTTSRVLGIGGPVIKNKTFFYFEIQALRARSSMLSTRTVFTATARQGILRYVKGGRNQPAGTSASSVDASGNPLPNVNIGTYNVANSDPQHIGLDPSLKNERMKLELRAEATNLTTSVMFGPPTATVTSSIFGRINPTFSHSASRCGAGTLPAVSRLPVCGPVPGISTRVRGCDTVSKEASARVPGPGGTAAGTSARATSLHASSCEKCRLTTPCTADRGRSRSARRSTFRGGGEACLAPTIGGGRGSAIPSSTAGSTQPRGQRRSSTRTTASTRGSR